MAGCTYTYRTLSLTYRPGRRSADLARLVSHFDRYLTYRSWAIPVRLIFSGRWLLNRGTVVVRDDDPDAVMAEAIERHRITAAIERVLAAHPDVEQAFVVGVPDDAIHAFLLLAAGGEPRDRQELEALVRGRLTPGRVPATITVLDEIPVTAAGKPDEQALASRTL